MDRRNFLKTGALLPALGVTAASVTIPSFINAAHAQSAAPADPAWRTFEVTTRVELLKPAGTTRIWLPVPLMSDTEYQKGNGNTWAADGGRVSFTMDPKYAAGIVYAEFPDSMKKPVVTLTNRFATRDYAVDPKSSNRARREDKAALAKYLSPTELMPIDGIVRRTAQEITKNARTDVDKAKAIYEWIVVNTVRDPKTRGCGVGDIKTMLETNNLSGKCADLNALFVGLARAIGVPARDVYGVRVARSEYGYRSLGVGTDNITRAQHCRAEFYSESAGWVPVDPADVRKVILEEDASGQLPITHEKVQAARERLFGSWEMNWLGFNYAHDVALPGAARNGKVAFFMYPQGETADGRLDCLDPDNFKYTMTAREIKAA